MHEHIERAVVEREPRRNVGESLRRERDLKAPLRMRAHRSLVETADAHPVSEVRCDGFAKRFRGVAAFGVEIDVRMPARDQARCRDPSSSFSRDYSWRYAPRQRARASFARIV